MTTAEATKILSSERACLVRDPDDCEGKDCRDCSLYTPPDDTMGAYNMAIIALDALDDRKLIAVPVQIGETMYFRDYDKSTIIEGKVTHIEVDITAQDTDIMFSCEYTGGHRWFFDDEIGHGIYRTRKETEEHPAEGDEDG